MDEAVPRRRRERTRVCVCVYVRRRRRATRSLEYARARERRKVNKLLFSPFYSYSRLWRLRLPFRPYPGFTTFKRISREDDTYDDVNLASCKIGRYCPLHRIVHRCAREKVPTTWWHASASRCAFRTEAPPSERREQARQPGGPNFSSLARAHRNSLLAVVRLEYLARKLPLQQNCLTIWPNAIPTRYN